MKTAVIYTGAMRAFEKGLPTQQWHVLRHFGELEFFVSTYKDGTESQVSALKEAYPDARVDIECHDAQPDCVAQMRREGVNLPTNWVPGTHYTHEPYEITVHPKAVLGQLWQLEQGMKLLRRANGIEKTEEPLPYDYVLRIRPDLWFHEFKMPTLLTMHSAVVSKFLAFTPWWGRFGGINDRFAILGSAAAESYFMTYSAIPQLAANGCPIHPESLIRASIEQDECYVNDYLWALFSRRKQDGKMETPEISPSDMAHLSTFR